LLGSNKAKTDSQVMTQRKQDEWRDQWTRYENKETFLFFAWIAPRTLEDFRNQRVFEAGCGPGHHTRLVAPVAQHVTAADLNTSDIARAKLAEFSNVTFVEADIATFQPEEAYDVVFCIGVIHHTDDPDLTFENLKRMTKPDGLMIVWCYSREGNALVYQVVEPLRELFLRRMNRKALVRLSQVITLLLYPIVHTVYRLPLRWLPFYEYFGNFRRLSFEFNVINVFDKLNAPQTQFISRERFERWFNETDFDDITITHYVGVSWRGSGRVKSKV
jgi:2-polyprenyl-3-methyl-5-hydroxy-6-metoxy-1,4-benzoquinol methylase